MQPKEPRIKRPKHFVSRFFPPYLNKKKSNRIIKMLNKQIQCSFLVFFFKYLE